MWHNFPHIDLIGTGIGLGGLGVFITLFHKSRDRMMEYKFLTREDFRRVEGKIDSLLNIAISSPYLSERHKEAIRPKGLDEKK